MHERADDHEHESDVADGQPRGQGGLIHLRFRHADDKGQQAPGGSVVHRRAGDGDDPEPSASHFAVRQNAGQHGKGRDRHRRPEKQGENREGNIRQRKDGVHRKCQHAPSRKGTTMLACEMATVECPLPEQAHIQLEPHDEHVEDDAELGDHLKRGSHRRRQNEFGPLAKSPRAATDRAGFRQSPRAITGGWPIQRNTSPKLRPAAITAARASSR